jgi:hypothetical protein
LITSETTPPSIPTNFATAPAIALPQHKKETACYLGENEVCIISIGNLAVTIGYDSLNLAQSMGASIVRRAPAGIPLGCIRLRRRTPARWRPHVDAHERGSERRLSTALDFIQSSVISDRFRRR